MNSKKDRAATIACLIACVVCFFWAVDALPVATPVHFDVGWPMDSCYILYIQDSVRVDSTSKRYNVTEWPDTNFDLAYGHIHRIRLYYWKLGMDSGNWEKTFDMYDYSSIGCGGTGTDSLIFYASDTGNDTRVEDVQITMYTTGGTQVGAKQTTDGSGKTIWALNPGDTLLPIVYGPHLYNWELPELVFTGQSTDSAMGYRIDPPAAAATAPYVTAYFDGGAGFVDSATGLMITRTNVIYYCQIIGAHAFADGSWGIVPQTQRKRPDANGRVTFLVVANLFLTPPTSYYRFWYQARDGTTRVRRTIRNFVVDSIPDPVNILTTTEVFPGP